MELIRKLYRPSSDPRYGELMEKAFLYEELGRIKQADAFAAAALRFIQH